MDTRGIIRGGRDISGDGGDGRLGSCRAGRQASIATDELVGIGLLCVKRDWCHLVVLILLGLGYHWVRASEEKTSNLPEDGPDGCHGTQSH
jgi:hypothetical protein